jgi:hypothetical protein
MLQVQREFVDVSPLLSPAVPEKRISLERNTIILTIGLITVTATLSVMLWLLGYTDWIIPGAAIVFCLHFYLLPSDLSNWEDMIFASVAVVAVIITPFWFPDQSWLWVLVAASACALACWLAAELRFQRILALQQAEN